MFVTVRNRHAERLEALVTEPRPPSRASYVAIAKLSVRRKNGWNGWLQHTLLAKHTLTACGCGLINCR